MQSAYLEVFRDSVNLSPIEAGRLKIFFETLLDGRDWSWTFVPQGFRFVGLLSLPALCVAAERRGARAHAALLCLVGLGMCFLSARRRRKQ